MTQCEGGGEGVTQCEGGGEGVAYVRQEERV